MAKNGEFSRGNWAFVFICEAALVITLIVLILFFSVPTERRLMDSVREVFHAKEIKYEQFDGQTNVFTLMNLDGRRKANLDHRNETPENAEWRFAYYDAGENWTLTIASLHFSSHNEAREYFQTEGSDAISIGGFVSDWYEYEDEQIKEYAAHTAFMPSGRPPEESDNRYVCNILYLESKSVVFIRFSVTPDVDEALTKKIEDLCYELSLPNPLELENTFDEKYGNA